MSRHSASPNSDIHHKVRLLLPGHINRSLPPDEADLVEKHTAECVDCKKELSICRGLAQQPPELPETWNPSPGHFASILSRIDRLEESASNKTTKAKPKPGFWTAAIDSFRAIPRAFQWTLALETAACFGLVLALTSVFYFPASKSYQTLSDNEKSIPMQGPAFRLLLAGDMTVEELAALLKQAKAQIRQGPSQVGSYVIEARSQSESETLAILRAHPKVRLAQKITLGTAD